MKRVYIPYWEWEDWKHGMWRKVPIDEYDKYLNQAILFTGDWVRYGQAMKEVIFEWPKTILNSLSNPSTNHRAFVGHCAAQYKMSIPEYITRAAWRELSDKQRIEANLQADNAIKIWKYAQANRKLRDDVGVKMLF